jgi:hypothetical protein
MYTDVASWRAYALARGNGAPTAANDATATAALMRGDDYIRIHYVGRRGVPEDAPGLAEAVHIAASAELATPGVLEPQPRVPADAKVLTAVGSIEWTPIPGAGRSFLPTLPSIDALLLPSATAFEVGFMAV